jgi:hypothetical protein
VVSIAPDLMNKQIFSTRAKQKVPDARLAKAEE